MEASEAAASEAGLLIEPVTGTARPDDATFRDIVEKYSRTVFRVAFRMTGNEQDAEEVVQETFLRAWRSLPAFEARSAVATWLYRIAVNCSLDLIRMRQRHDERREMHVAAGAGPGEHEIDRVALLAADAPGPDRLLLSAEVGQRLERTMKRLTPLERAAFTLRHYEGLSIDEIAQTLGLRQGAVKNNVFRAVRKLREALEPLVAR